MCYRSMIGVVAIGMAMTASQALAQDAGYKIRGDANPRTYAYTFRGQDISPAPMVMRSEPARGTVAQAPQQTRSYSYEPSTNGANASSHPAASAAPAPAQAERRVYRSYSYESPRSSYRAPSRRTVSPGMRDAGAKIRGE